ncbi:hypothetical protein ANO11243_013690 [Dothideomycetidae sp. 11243]|nr:hypothetical protein ANO11243_013690 [fungal sp. No.11243]
MLESDIQPTPKRPARGRGRPPKVPRPDSDQEPPNKKRKYATRTPILSQGQLGRNAETPRGLDELPSDGDFLPSAPKSDLNDDASFSPAPPEENPVSPRTMRARNQSRSRPSYARTRSRGLSTATPRPRYSSAAAAAAASKASDGYKPREERSWEEFHPDLDIEVDLTVYTADEVDGRTTQDPILSGLRHDITMIDVAAAQPTTGLGIANMNGDSPYPHRHELQAPTPPIKRRPGRPPRRPESMLSGLGSPPAPRILPLPIHNPKERLNLPKPSYRQVQTFRSYEEDKKVRVDDYVDKSMANVGYQESELFDIPQHALIRHAEAAYDDELGAALTLASDEIEPDHSPPQIGDVEYDMDEQDERWLETHNIHRKSEQVDPIKPSMFEIAMTQIEREYYALEKRIPKPNPRHANQTRPRSSSAAAVNGEPWGAGDEPDSKCAICDDGDCENANAIIFCDGCDLAVHQECYGVPFIPEGQWFCRKCKEIGRGTPTCIFCPNIEGAFKQTNTLRWSHLLCAIWIPEVSLANLTYMEPIQDVEKVPRNRWGLVCYICEQRMGACIQCSNKSCYQAFHVTCARRARLFLKMKASPTSSIDQSILKAFCDRHVSPEWRRDHDTDTAIIDAKRYYRKTMRNRRWADSQTAALAMATNDGPVIEPTVETDLVDDKNSANAAGNKRKKKEPTKAGWRLPSGAPVVPSVVFAAVEQSLARFMLRKRKEFVIEACKYWTLKREARRGAALLKRLQLQLENSSSMEITRRNFVAMGAAGRPRLVRRIDFAELLQNDITGLLALAEKTTTRERKKLEDAENLKRIMDSVYFPVADLLWPILKKAQKLGEKTRIFEDGLSVIEQKVAERQYNSVFAFSRDIGAVFADIVSRPDLDSLEEHKPQDINEIHSHLAPNSMVERQAMSAEQKQQKTVAKRIVRAIRDPLEVALRRESDLKGIPFEKESSEWAKLDARLEACIPGSSDGASSHDGPITNGSLTSTRTRIGSDATVSATGGASPMGNHSDSTKNGSEAANEPLRAGKTNGKADPVQEPSPPISSSTNQDATSTSRPSSSSAGQLLDPDANHFLTRGGVPWYMRAFDPEGTTMYTERWLGPDRSRAESEALSEIDEATLNDMAMDLDSEGEDAVEDDKLSKQSGRKGAATSARSPKKTRSSLKAANAGTSPVKPVPAALRTTRATRAGSNASPAPSVNGGHAGNRSTRNTRTSIGNGGRRGSTRAGIGLDGSGDQDVDEAEAEVPDTTARTATSSRPHRGDKIKTSSQAEPEADDDPDGETEKDRVAREKRERYNAKRRAARRKGF